MVAYSFQRRFIQPIREGRKQQTIRAPRRGMRGHACDGDELQLYFGMRTRHCMLIGKYRCVGSGAVSLIFHPTDPECDRALVFGVEQTLLDTFAYEDGFADWAELRAFWQAEHPGAFRAGCFEGAIIFWGPE